MSLARLYGFCAAHGGEYMPVAACMSVSRTFCALTGWETYGLGPTPVVQLLLEQIARLEGNLRG